jgi:hypothetical protein
MMKMDYRSEASRMWPKAAWIDGSGRYACVSRCEPAVTVYLFPTQEQAIEAVDGINSCGCGRGCVKNHAVVDLGIKC